MSIPFIGRCTYTVHLWTDMYIAEGTCHCFSSWNLNNAVRYFTLWLSRLNCFNLLSMKTLNLSFDAKLQTHLVTNHKMLCMQVSNNTKFHLPLTPFPRCGLTSTWHFAPQSIYKKMFLHMYLINIIVFQSKSTHHNTILHSSVFCQFCCLVCQSIHQFILIHSSLDFLP